MIGPEPQNVTPTATNAEKFSATEATARLDAGGFAIPKIRKAAAAILYNRIHHHSFGYRHPDGTYEQVSGEQLTRHFAATYAAKWMTHPSFNRADFLRGLTSKRIATGETIYGRGRFVQEKTVKGRIVPNMTAGHALLRFDVDEHHGETDGAALAKWVCEKLAEIGVTAFQSSSNHGYSVYAWAAVRKWIKPSTGERIPMMARKRANQVIDRMRIAMTAMAEAASFRAKLELQGGFLETDQPRDKNDHDLPTAPQTLAPGTLHGRNAAKISTSSFRCIRDVEIFRDAILDLSSVKLEKLIAEGMLAARSSVPKNPPAPLPPIKKQKRRKRHSKSCIQRAADIEDKGDSQKYVNTRISMVEAVCNMGLREVESIKENLAEIWDETNRIYEAAGLAGGQRDRDRESRFKDALKWITETWWDEAKAGKGGKNDPHWFADVDIADAIRRMTGKISNHRLAVINTKLSASRSPRLTREKLAVIFCTIQKNAKNRYGCSGKKAHVGMLAYFGLSANGSTNAAATLLLQEIGWLRIIRAPMKNVANTAWAVSRPTATWRARMSAASQQPPHDHRFNKAPGPVCGAFGVGNNCQGANASLPFFSPIGRKVASTCAESDSGWPAVSTLAPRVASMPFSNKYPQFHPYQRGGIAPAVKPTDR